MKILAFGEVLWDVFSNEKTIGGAPFNFAAHAVKQGAKVDLVTALGKDSLAEETNVTIKKHAVGTKYIYVSPLCSGICNVTLDSKGEPNYELIMPVAYDDIILSENQLDEIAATGYDCMYYGTLALRGKTSLSTLQKLIKLNCFKEILCDVNIRQKYYSADVLTFALENATIAKISREEMSQVSLCLIGKDATDYVAFCHELFSRFCRLHTIILTLDKNGAMVADKDGNILYSMLPVNKVVSAVGAGDSFTATFIVSRFDGYSLEDCVNRAVKVSDFVVTQSGAVPDYIPSKLLG